MVQAPLRRFDCTFLEQGRAMLDDELLEGLVQEVGIAERLESALQFSAFDQDAQRFYGPCRSSMGRVYPAVPAIKRS